MMYIHTVLVDVDDGTVFNGERQVVHAGLAGIVSLVGRSEGLNHKLAHKNPLHLRGQRGSGSRERSVPGDGWGARGRSCEDHLT